MDIQSRWPHLWVDLQLWCEKKGVEQEVGVAPQNIFSALHTHYFQSPHFQKLSTPLLWCLQPVFEGLEVVGLGGLNCGRGRIPSFMPANSLYWEGDVGSETLQAYHMIDVWPLRQGIEAVGVYWLGFFSQVCDLCFTQPVVRSLQMLSDIPSQSTFLSFSWCGGGWNQASCTLWKVSLTFFFLVLGHNSSLKEVSRRFWGCMKGKS